MLTFTDLVVGQVWQAHNYARTLTHLGKKFCLYEIDGVEYSYSREAIFKAFPSKLIQHENGADIDTEVYEYQMGNKGTGWDWWHNTVKEWRLDTKVYGYDEILTRRKKIQPILVEGKQIPSGSEVGFDEGLYEYLWAARGPGFDYWSLSFKEWSSVDLCSGTDHILYRKALKKAIGSPVIGLITIDGREYSYKGTITGVNKPEARSYDGSCDF